jgi:hypothetical protein
VLLPPPAPESKGLVERRNGWFETSFMPGRSFTPPLDFNGQFADWLHIANRGWCAPSARHHWIGLRLIEQRCCRCLRRASALNLIRAGHASVLIGQSEGGWFDVKKQLYDITHLKGKVSLAQAVARFANSEGGVVVFGMGTKKVGSGEVVSKVYPVNTDTYTIRRHRQTLEAHLYPLPIGLDVEIVPVTGGALLVVHVPPQPDAAKPFLVHGAIVGDGTEGAFISIVRRHGEDTIPTTAPAIHAAMSINRILDRLDGQLIARAELVRPARRTGRVAPKRR